MAGRTPTLALPVPRVLAAASRALRAGGVESPRSTAEWLLAGVLRCGRAELFLRPWRVPGRAAARYRRWVARRLAGEPLQYILGSQAFLGLEFAVNRRVFIPRPETDLVAEAAARCLGARGRGEGGLCWDVGTGSGCLAVALAVEHPALRTWASDISSSALRVARQNAVRHGVAERIEFFLADGLSRAGAVPGAGVRPWIVVANPPYVAHGALARLPREVRWEPARALDGGNDGLAVIRRWVPASARWLPPRGWLVMEIGQGQAGRVRRLVQATGAFASAVVERDHRRIERVLVARRGA